MSKYVTEIEWEKISVYSVTSDGTMTEFYKAWKSGHPGLVGYGLTVRDAIVAMLNKHGE